LYIQTLNPFAINKSVVYGGTHSNLEPRKVYTELQPLYHEQIFVYTRGGHPIL